MEKCYDCGTPLTKDNYTKEHIPAKNLFNGYPPEYKNNRLTVPACYVCNSKYSKIDQEIRDAIGIMNEKDPKQQELTRQAVKSILRRSDWHERVERNALGQVVSVSFNYDVLRELHIKNFKGIFYSIYGFHVPENFQIEIISDGDEGYEKLLKAAQVFHDYVDSFHDWKESGHKDVFMYNMKTMTSDKEGKIFDGQNVEESMGVVGVLLYHQKLSAVVMAAKNDFLEHIKSKYK